MRRLLKLMRAFLKAGVMEGGLGSPLSPSLSNIVFDEFDRELERRGLRSRRAGARVMKSRTANREPERRIAPKAVLRFEEGVRELTRRTRGVSVEKWPRIGYFGRSQTPSVLEDLEK